MPPDVATSPMAVAKATDAEINWCVDCRFIMLLLATALGFVGPREMRIPMGLL
jgi:hypothetical protein